MSGLRKRCDKCSTVRLYPARARRCRLVETRFGRRYYCYGNLRLVVTATPKPSRRPQDVAADKLAHARKMVSDKTKQMARLASSLRQWERKAAYYAKRASMTDAEVEAEREKAAAARANGRAIPPHRRRNIRISEEIARGPLSD